MTDPRTFLFPEQPQDRAHPVVQFWADALKGGVVDRLEVDVRQPRQGLTLGPARIAVLGRRDDGTAPTPPSYVEWELEIHSGLVPLGARAVDPRVEARRYALVLHDRFKPIERRYGDGYFNTVLLQVLADAGLDASPAVAQVLGSVHRGGMVAPSEHASACATRIRIVLQTVSIELVGALDYTEDDAIAIVGGALAEFLDRRFSVSTRRELGWG